MRRVVFVQRSLPHYRIPFLQLLRQRLQEADVAFEFVYARPTGLNGAKKDEVDLPWGHCVPIRSVKIGGMQAYWQAVNGHVNNQDLIIATQANKDLINYTFMLRRKLKGQKFAYWGHGRNLKTAEGDIRNRFKNFFLRQCDWWFAYTEGVKRYVASQHFPEARITAVQNAVDTRQMQADYAAVSPHSLEELRQQHGIASKQVGIFCSGIYAEKKIPFLLEACHKIKQALPEFQLLVVGAGPEAHLFESAAARHEWIHYLGPRFGPEKAALFKLASAYLMPGLVGLGILDAFAFETPIITTRYPYHSPEIEYLAHGENGMMCEQHIEEYASCVVQVLSNTALRSRLIAGCRRAAATYTIENMASNFAKGVLQCLEL
ncbi:MAG: glycosyltransferase [Bacteroidetes bacterium]|nr:MAG: glycosyltransferase [Bacteroidota bacterium]